MIQNTRNVVVKPPTAEDFRIIMRLYRWRPAFAVTYAHADAIDAELMRRLVLVRAEVDAQVVTNEPFEATVHVLMRQGLEVGLACYGSD